MRNLGLLLCILSACAADSMDPRDGRGGGGGGKADGFDDLPGAQFDATWKIQKTDGSPAACPAGYDTIAFYSQPLDAQGKPNGSPIVDLFDCSTGSGATAELDAGDYQVWIEIANHDNTAVYAKSTSARVDLAPADTGIDFSILTDGGYFSFAWSLVGATSNQALDCSAVTGLDGIETVATSISGPSSAIVDKFDCADQRAITAGLPAGTYTVSVDAFNAQEQALGVAPALTNKTIEGPNKVTDLGHVTIPIDGR